MSELRLWCAKCGRVLIAETYKHSPDVYKVQPCQECQMATAKPAFEAGMHHGISLVLGKEEGEDTSAEKRARNCEFDCGSDMDHHDWTDNTEAGPE